MHRDLVEHRLHTSPVVDIRIPTASATDTVIFLPLLRWLLQFLLGRLLDFVRCKYDLNFADLKLYRTVFVFENESVQFSGIEQLLPLLRSLRFNDGWFNDLESATLSVVVSHKQCR